MPTAIVTSKGRITVPQAVRLALGLRAGSKVDLVAVAGGFKMVASSRQGTHLKGRFAGRNSQSVTIESMNEAISAEVSPPPGRPA